MVFFLIEKHDTPWKNHVASEGAKDGVGLVIGEDIRHIHDLVLISYILGGVTVSHAFIEHHHLEHDA